MVSAVVFSKTSWQTIKPTRKKPALSHAQRLAMSSQELNTAFNASAEMPSTTVV
jgi:hypothetical protein